MVRPNIIFILADDLGYADLSVYGQRDFSTPHLDKLASQGVRFTQAYANSAVCSATRFALITGQYQYRLPGGLEEPLVRVSDKLGLPPDLHTLPSLLKKQGYSTALIGKWHLGRPPNFGPLKSGYDVFFGNHAGAIDYFTHKPGVGDDIKSDLWEGDVPVERTGYYTEILANEATRYVADHSKSEDPYFLSLHFTAPHWPWEGPEDEEESKRIKNLFHADGGNLRKYGELVEALDAAVGKVLDAVKKGGKGENTVVVFTSDNGGERFSCNWPFIGQKTELLEGGLRVPALLSWPAKLAPQVTDQVTITMDWLPTLLAAAGTEPDPNFPTDGIDLLPILEGREPKVPRTLYWRYKAQGQQALRSGDLKYLRINDNEFLFNVVEDTHERANLKDRYPDEHARLREKWHDFDRQFLPITDDVFSHGITPDVQADHYVPAFLKSDFK